MIEAKGGNLDHPAVQRVRTVLIERGWGDRVVELSDTARSAQDAASALGVELGAIVKTLVFTVGETPVLALIAGDNRCREKALADAFGLEGKVRRPDAATVKAVTGYAIGGVSPVGIDAAIPVVIDKDLDRFETVYAAAGHPHCVFPIAPAGLLPLTGGTVSETVAERSG